MCALFFYALHSIISCFHVLEYWHETSTTRLLHLVQAQNVHATVELAACQSGVFNATFLLNGSDERQQSGRIKAVGCWFESGRCVGAFKVAYFFQDGICPVKRISYFSDFLF